MFYKDEFRVRAQININFFFFLSQSPSFGPLYVPIEETVSRISLEPETTLLNNRLWRIGHHGKIKIRDHWKCSLVDLHTFKSGRTVKLEIKRQCLHVSPFTTRVVPPCHLIKTATNKAHLLYLYNGLWPHCLDILRFVASKLLFVAQQKLFSMNVLWR